MKVYNLDNCITVCNADEIGKDPIGLKNIAGDLINPSTEDKQDVLNALTVAIESYLEDIKDQTDQFNFTLGALDVNASLTFPTDLAKEVKQDTQISLATTLNATDFATQTTLLAVLNKLIAAPSTEAKQDTLNALIVTIDGVLDSIKTDTSKLDVDLSTRATESTLNDVKTQTDKLNFTAGALDVNATVSPAAGVKRSIATIESLVDGSTTDDVQSMSIWFDGKNGTLDGVDVPDGYVASYSPNGGSDTVGSIAYTVPDTKGLRVVITYVYKV